MPVPQNAAAIVTGATAINVGSGAVTLNNAGNNFGSVGATGGAVVINESNTLALDATNAGSLVVGILLMGLSSYVPLYSQRVLGTGALVAGLALAAMTIGWPVAAATAAPIMASTKATTQ